MAEGYQNNPHAKTDYTLSGILTTPTPKYDFYKVGNVGTLAVQQIWMSSITKDSWTKIGDFPSDLVVNNLTNPASCFAVFDSQLGNIIGIGMVEIRVNTNELYIKTNVTQNSMVGIRGQISFL